MRGPVNMRVPQLKIDAGLRRRLGVLLLILGCALALRAWCPFGLVLVVGKSMEPALRKGQLLLLDRGHCQTNPPSPGEIVSFWHEGRKYIKRVIVVGPQTVWKLRGSSAADVFVPPEHVAKARQWLARYPQSGVLVPVLVPAGAVFLVGDNGCLSYDSRDFGPVPISQVIGKVSPLIKAQRATRAATFVGDGGGIPVLPARRTGGASAVLRQRAAGKVTTPG